MNERDIYLKRTTATGKVTITHHRAWDADRFIAANQERARSDSAKNPNDAYQISLATEAEYKAARQ